MMEKQLEDKIPFNRPPLMGQEIEYIIDSCSRHHLSGDGHYTKKSQAFLENLLSCPKVFLTHSCTAALEMAALLYKLKPGDEVILPSYTFVSTANAFALRGARPVFVDIREDTLNMDESLLEELITDKTKLIVPVHYAGVSCEMDKILKVAKKHHIPVVEDSAQGLGSYYKGRALGSLGDLGTFSFHETKNCISGEGGALSINDENLILSAEIIREKGTNRSQFYRGYVDKYTWVDVGSSYLPSELVSSFLYAQLEKLDKINGERLDSYDFYYENLLPLQGEGKVRLPIVPEECQHNGHLFYMLTSSPEERNALIDFMRAKGIASVFHYIPLHSAPKGREYHDGRELAVTDRVASTLIRLPLFYGLQRDQQERVIEAVYQFYGS